MKTKLFLAASLLATSITYSQWTQLGSDIDGEAAGDLSGSSVSLSSDGSVVAIGAYRNDGNGEDAGHVRVYKSNGTSWTQLGSDIDGEAVGDSSGSSVSLSSDGSVVAIGATRNDGTGKDVGHVRVYKIDGSTWIQLGSDIDGENAEDSSGSSVSLSSDGSVVAIGAYGNGEYAGHVRVYKIDGTTWTQLGSDIDGEAVGDSSGSSVSLSSDGSVVAIGALYNDGRGNEAGHVRVYKTDGISWTQIGSDIDGEAAYNYSGGVSLSSDGSVVAIGAIGNDGTGEAAGHVRVYKTDGSTWTQVGSDIDGEAAYDRSGGSVSLSNDGSVVAIGATRNTYNVGHVRVYKSNGTSWTQIGSDIDGEASYDEFGSSVSLSSDGSVVAIGASELEVSKSVNAGHVRVYKFNVTNLAIIKNNIEGLFLSTSNGVMVSNLNNVSLTIYNITGQKVANQNLQGIYMVKAIDNNGNIASVKVLVE